MSRHHLTRTDKMKLATNPAPAAARPSCGIVRGCAWFKPLGSREEEYVRMIFWKEEYARKRAAVSTIEPAIGADSP